MDERKKTFKSKNIEKFFAGSKVKDEFFCKYIKYYYIIYFTNYIFGDQHIKFSKICRYFECQIVLQI